MAGGLEHLSRRSCHAGLALSVQNARLGRRRRDLVWFHTMRVMDLEEESMHDLNPSVSFASSCVGHTPCIASSSTYWLRKRQRVLHGCEALAL